MIPTLILKNVECRNFLNDYQSLIHSEVDNFLYFKDYTKIVHKFGGFMEPAKIVILNSKIVDSSFTYGMIYSPVLMPKLFQHHRIPMY
jgi:hypothetical protein